MIRMPHMQRLLALLVLLALLPAPSRAKEETDLQARVDALARPFVEGEVVTGMVVGIVKDGERHVFGYGRVRPGEDGAPDGRTVYEIGSVSKVFTGILLADLVREGVVRLDQPVDELLPEGVRAPSRDERRITLRDLSTHTSGLPRMPSNFEPADPADPYADYDAERLLAWLKDAKLERVPGERYGYSNLGVALLGYALTRAAGEPYEVLLRKRILDPLGMADTAVVPTEAMRARLAPGTTADGAPAPGWDLGVFVAAGGIRSTVDDLLTFLEANLEDAETPLAASMATARAEHAAPGGHGVRMGLGWHFGSAPGGRWHNGQTGGYHAHVGLLLDDGIGIVVLANTATGEVDRFANLLYALLLGKPVEPPAIQRPATIDPAVLDDYVGRYALAPIFVLTVTREGDRLMVQATGQARHRVFPLGDDRFFYRVVEAQIDFTRDDEGKVTGLVLHQGGRDVPGWRQE